MVPDIGKSPYVTILSPGRRVFVEADALPKSYILDASVYSSTIILIVSKKANPSQDGDAKSWIPWMRDRQTAEVVLSAVFLL